MFVLLNQHTRHFFHRVTHELDPPSGYSTVSFTFKLDNMINGECVDGRIPCGEMPEWAIRVPGRADLLSLVLRLSLLGVVSFYAVRWAVDALDPTRRQKQEAQKQADKVMASLGVRGLRLSEYETVIATNLVDPLAMRVSWSDIAGLDSIVSDLRDTVILPIQKRSATRRSTLLQPPKGVLLFGPPGCGKTLVARATARESGCRFINLDPSSLTDKWYGESQKLTAAVFSLALKLQPTIIFIDEIDAFLRRRSSSDHEATAMMKAQFMALWDGLMTDHGNTVVVFGATNRPQDVDPAILRRLPQRYHIPPPTADQRLAILELVLKDEEVDDDVCLTSVAVATDGWAGSDLRELCREAAVARVNLVYLVLLQKRKRANLYAVTIT
uniref:Outer mitochondrial transmembrane helix translocase n=1 Tax=Eptatretus burgeri TaxID=7764 RepID=A0A8C4R6W6_EPTBU